MALSNIRLERQGSVAWLWLNRPPVNALDDAMLTSIAVAAREVSAEAGVRVLVIAGAGEKGFAAGADIGELKATQGPWGAVVRSRRWHDTLAAIEDMPQPVIAMIHGFCLGGGLELAMAADLRVAGTGTSFGQPEATLGIIPGGGGTQRLARLVGPARAKRLIFTGRRLGAAEALQWGLVDEVVPDAQLRTSVAALATEIAARAPLALGAAKVAIRRGLDTDLASGLALEAAMWGVVFGTADRVEGTTAFLEKRKAEFEGR